MKDREKLPSIHREIFVQEKRMNTIAALEKVLNRFSRDLKDVMMDCPFGQESVEVQQLVTNASAWCANYQQYTNATRNMVLSTHYEDMKTLAENENIIGYNPKEEAEDVVARIKSNLTDELEVSRAVRKQDQIEVDKFHNRLKKLESDFVSLLSKPDTDDNRGNRDYSVVE